VDLEALVTDRYAFGDINLAIEDLRSGKVTGRCIVEIAPELDR
jgi:Zn-dependent alcohol dehydrogenase